MQSIFGFLGMAVTATTLMTSTDAGKLRILRLPQKADSSLARWLSQCRRQRISGGIDGGLTEPNVGQVAWPAPQSCSKVCLCRKPLDVHRQLPVSANSDEAEKGRARNPQYKASR